MFNLILMDVQMPEMDGYEATEFIRTKMETPKSEIPIIALTAFATEGQSEKCLAAGMNGFVSKPFRADELCAKILLFAQKKS
jgi:two-component system, sensor histidine kinase